MARKKTADDSKAPAAAEAVAAPKADAGASSPVTAEAAGQMPAVTDAPPEQKRDGGAGNAAGPAVGGGETMTIAYPPPAEMPAALLKDAKLVVKAKPERGRRRAGYAFTRAETEIPFDALDKEQLDALAGDTELVVALRLVKPA